MNACTFQIDQLAPDKYRATTTVFPDLQGFGATAEDASRALNAEIARHLRRELGEQEAEESRPSL